MALPLGLASGLMAAPDMIRRLVSPDEDEGRMGAALEAGLYALPAAKPALRGLRGLSKAAPMADNALAASDDVLPESWKAFVSETPLSKARPKPSAGSLMDDGGVASLADNAEDTLGYSTPGLWQQADNMFESTRRQHPGIADAFDQMSKDSDEGLRTVRGMYSPEAMRRYPSTPRVRTPEPVADDVFDEVDLSLETRGGPTYDARRAQELARAWRTNRPLSTEF